MTTRSCGHVVLEPKCSTCTGAPNPHVPAPAAPRELSCGCCEAGCVCHHHQDVPRGVPVHVCAYHQVTPHTRTTSPLPGPDDGHIGGPMHR